MCRTALDGVGTVDLIGLKRLNPYDSFHSFFLMLPCAPKFAGHAARDGVSAKAARSLDRLRLNKHIVDCLHIAFAWNI